MYLRHAKEEGLCVSSETLQAAIPPILMELADGYMSTTFVATNGRGKLLFPISTHPGTRPEAVGGALEIDRDLAVVPGLRCVRPTFSHLRCNLVKHIIAESAHSSHYCTIELISIVTVWSNTAITIERRASQRMTVAAARRTVRIVSYRIQVDFQ